VGPLQFVKSGGPGKWHFQKPGTEVRLPGFFKEEQQNRELTLGQEKLSRAR
jgi:hypothetical protein